MTIPLTATRFCRACKCSRIMYRAMQKKPARIDHICLKCGTPRRDDGQFIYATKLDRTENLNRAQNRLRLARAARREKILELIR